VLPRELRLKESSRFQTVYRRGRSWSNREMVVYALPRPAPEKRFGFVVGKKLGGAVHRNRVRRLLREACRALVSNVPMGVDIVIVGRPAAAEASLAELTCGMQSLFERAGLWRNEGDPSARYRLPQRRPPSSEVRSGEEA
jgi:ribonuclease P protein component